MYVDAQSSLPQPEQPLNLQSQYTINDLIQLEQKVLDLLAQANGNNNDTSRIHQGVDETLNLIVLVLNSIVTDPNNVDLINNSWGIVKSEIAKLTALPNSIAHLLAERIAEINAKIKLYVPQQVIMPVLPPNVAPVAPVAPVDVPPVDALDVAPVPPADATPIGEDFALMLKAIHEVQTTPDSQKAMLVARQFWDDYFNFPTNEQLKLFNLIITLPIPRFLYFACAKNTLGYLDLVFQNVPTESLMKIEQNIQKFIKNKDINFYDIEIEKAHEFLSVVLKRQTKLDEEDSDGVAHELDFASPEKQGQLGVVAHELWDIATSPQIKQEQNTALGKIVKFTGRPFLSLRDALNWLEKDKSLFELLQPVRDILKRATTFSDDDVTPDENVKNEHIKVEEDDEDLQAPPAPLPVAVHEDKIDVANMPLFIKENFLKFSVMQSLDSNSYTKVMKDNGWNEYLVVVLPQPRDLGLNIKLENIYKTLFDQYSSLYPNNIRNIKKDTFAKRLEKLRSVMNSPQGSFQSDLEKLAKHTNLIVVPHDDRDFSKHLLGLGFDAPVAKNIAQPKNRHDIDLELMKWILQ
jgi:hypothetical protein